MTTQQVIVTIAGTAPNYDVKLNPPGPYRFSQLNSTLAMTLDAASISAGFRMAGIGFEGIYHGRSTAAAEAQICAQIKSIQADCDTLEVQDAVSADGRYEFVMLYEDRAGTLYGLDPDILNGDG